LRTSRFAQAIRGLSEEIKTIQVYAPHAKPYVAIEEQFNFADPFSSVWGKLDTGIVKLDPGQSVNWIVRLEIFTPSK
jgi:aldose 1-epimerase